MTGDTATALGPSLGLVPIDPRHWVRDGLHLGVAGTADFTARELPSMLFVTALAEAINVVGYLVLGHILRDRRMAVPALEATAESPEMRSVADRAVLMSERRGWVRSLLVTASAELLGTGGLVRLVARSAWELHGRCAAEGHARNAHPAVAGEARSPGRLQRAVWRQILVAGQAVERPHSLYAHEYALVTLAADGW
ncbi:MAG: hypothetical protein ACUVTZ_06095 [Armatimonadota bacterium]